MDSERGARRKNMGTGNFTLSDAKNSNRRKSIVSTVKDLGACFRCVSGDRSVGEMQADCQRGTLRESIEREKMMDDVIQRRSFSSALRWGATTSKAGMSFDSSSRTSSFSLLSSASSSANATRSFCQQQQQQQQVPVLKRSRSANLETELSVQGAIAYCKKSQQTASARKSVGDAEYYPFQD